jgi:uncharacterized membrane protein YkoI
MPHPARKMLVALAVLGAAALGGSALAGAASKGSTSSRSTTPSQSSAQQGQPPGGAAPGNGATGGHVGRNGQRETLLTGDVAAKVKAAALAKVSGGTIERVETDADHGSPYEAHVRKSDGTELEVLVNKDFQVTAVNTMQHR